MMKILKVLPLFLLISAHIIPQSNFSIEAYKQFLQSHQNMTTQDLLNMYESGVFYGDINQTYNDAAYFSQIDSAYNLTQFEKNLINRNGFMISERLKQMTFGHALLEIYNKDLPVYISTDAILHTIHQSYDRILKKVELEWLISGITNILDQMHQHMFILEQNYTPNMQMQQMLKDVDVYITVARKLLNNSSVPFYSENSTTVDYYLNRINNNSGLVSEKIFAEHCRRVDWSQFKPRGHYTDEYYPQLAKYFKAMMWLGRTELYLAAPGNVSQDDPCFPDFKDVQRQAIMSFLLRELFEISNISSEFQKVEGILKYFVGEPDNVTVDDLAYLKNSLNFQSTDALLDSLKFVEFQDSLKKQSFAYQKILSQVLISDPMQPDSIIPASAFMLFGQRFIIDSYVMSTVVYDKINYNGDKICRLFPSTLDPMFALGNDAAAQLLTTELDKHKYASNLAGLRYLIDSYDQNFWNSTIYTQWLNSIRQLNPPADRGSLPLYMKSAAFWQKQLNTQLASWTQLRHDNLLYAKQSYTGGTVCSFPYTYIEPFPEFYDALKNYGTLGKQKFTELNLTFAINYFNQLESTCDTLRIIAEKELSGVAYTSQETDFLHRVIYNHTAGSGEPPYEGWYPKLLFDASSPEDALLKQDYLVADIHTVPTDCGGNFFGWVMHVGTGPVNMGVFIADVPGFQKTAFIGPVYSYYEYTTLNFLRLTDEEWLNEYVHLSGRPNWVNIYLADSSGNSRGTGASLVTDVKGNIIKVPDDYFAVENYPNPFNPSTTIYFRIPREKAFNVVTVEIYNVQGELVKRLHNGDLPDGDYYIKWDGTNVSNTYVSSGVYLCKVSIGDVFKTIKMTLVK